MNSIYPLILACGILLVSGCDIVFTPEPLGDKAVQLKTAEWQGTWLAPDMVVITTVLDEDKGLLQAAWMARGLSGVKLEVLEGSIRASGDIMFINSRDDNPDAEPRYLWGMVDKSKDHLTIWAPDLTQFKAMVAAGTLPGEVGLLIDAKHLEDHGGDSDRRTASFVGRVGDAASPAEDVAEEGGRSHRSSSVARRCLAIAAARSGGTAFPI